MEIITASVNWTALTEHLAEESVNFSNHHFEEKTIKIESPEINVWLLSQLSHAQNIIKLSLHIIKVQKKMQISKKNIWQSSHGNFVG